VTSNDSLFRKIRRVAAEGVRLETVPEAAIAEAVASLGRNRDGLLAGYLYAYLIQRMTVHSPDLEMSLLGQMIADHSVPTYALREITAEMGVQYFRLSTDGRTTVVRTFVDLAQRTDPQEAANGFVGLAQIEHFHDEVRNIIRPETMRKLAVIYRALVQRRSLSRNPPIEALLGIRE
jgi:hypothetical protein